MREPVPIVLKILPGKKKKILPGKNLFGYSNPKTHWKTQKSQNMHGWK